MNDDHYCIHFQLKSIGLSSKILAYCLRFSQELALKNITIHKLLSWSIPIDLVEKYQQYLDDSLFGLEKVIQNCTFPWFGGVFQFRLIQNKELSQMASYTHLQCRRAPNIDLETVFCLD